MRRLISLCFGFCLGLVAMFLAFNFHFVRTDSDWHFVKKKSAQLTDFYADVRDWNLTEWTKHPELMRAVVDSGQKDLIPQPSGEDLIGDALRLWESAQRASESLNR